MMRKMRNITAFLTGCALALSAVGTLSASAASGTDEQTLRDYVEIMVSQVNDARAAQGLSELYIAPVVCDYAQARAEELTLRMTHDRPDGSSCFQPMKDDGFFYNYAAENIAAGNLSPVGTFEQFMNSPKHKQNILSPDMTHIGIGYCFDPNAEPLPDKKQFAYYWSMMLIGVYDAHSTPLTFEGQYIPVRELGDSDGTKQITAADASRILQYSASLRSGADPHVTDAFQSASDVNGDGSINAIDAQIILKYAAAQGTDPDAKLADFVWG